MLGQTICGDTWSSVIVYRLTPSDIYQYSIVYILMRSVIRQFYVGFIVRLCLR